MKELFDKLYNKSEESFYKILDKNLKEDIHCYGKSRNFYDE